MGSPRGKPVRKINKVLLEVEKNTSLGTNAMNLKESSAEAEEVVRKKVKGKEKE